MDFKGIGKGALIAALGTVGGTLILTALSWAFGFHHAAWLAIKSASSGIGGALVFLIPLPTWVVAVFLAAFLYLLRWCVRHVFRRTIPATISAAVVDEPPPLTDNETALIRLLARADGTPMNASELATRAALAKLVTAQTLDKLRGRGFMKEIVGWQGVRLYSLTPAGRDYVIAKGYVPPAPTVAERRALR